MNNIDFSCKHDIWIRSDDGRLQRMDEPFFESELIAPGTWKILSDGDFTYLIEGDDEALVIDSGYGCGNIREYCQSLTSKPVWRIANTHDHFDHTANNAYFEGAYMSEETRKRATIPFPSFSGIDFPRDYRIEVIDEGYVFFLGGRDIETLSIPDHAPGSLAFLDSKEKLFFTGDEVMHQGKSLRISVAAYEKQLQKLYARRKEYDRLCTGGSGIISAVYIDNYLANARFILAGNEGQPAQPREVLPEPLPDEQGRMIYGRKVPRPMDLPKTWDADIEYKRMMNYADCTIVYDMRHIYG